MRAGTVGGGVLEGGFQGEYFAANGLTGSPAFERRDVRIDFDWGVQGRPGGSRSPGFREVGTDGFSVRWTGRVVARFSERYTFVVSADDEARLWMRGPGVAEWVLLAIQPGVGGGPGTVDVPMQAGVVYEFRLEYEEREGEARVSLRWRSPSTPEEVVEAAGMAALNMDTYAEEIWANAMDGARDEWRDPAFSDDPARWPARDALGWPLGDAGIIVWEGAEPASMQGRYRLSFEGRARVTAQGTAAQFFVDGVSVGSVLGLGQGWDPGSNTTTVEVEMVPLDILFLYFTQTRRGVGDAVPTGVTNVRLMRPRAEGGGVAQASGERFDGRARRAFGRYQALRWISNFERERTWQDRVLPAYSTHRDAGTRRHWELMVQLSNETGKDLYVCLPHAADDEYVRNVARLIRYGSDGERPYDGPVADPVHPPLNPNLRVYLERGNELWNWSFSQAPESAGLGVAEVRAGTANGAILNFDGRNPTGDQFYRWHALRSLQMSEIFRSVWGDAAMGGRVRFLLEYQYDNDQNTAASAFDFLDRYFNNADGRTHVAEPHPVNHFFWGGGAAVYYGSGNSQGVQTHTPVGNGGFELPETGEGAAVSEPAGSGWNFAGTAGVYRGPAVSDLWTVANPGTAGNALTERRALGCRITVGAQPLGVYELGRAVVGPGVGYHEILLIRETDRQTVARVEIPAGTPVEDGWVTRRLTLPAVLEPGAAYFLVSTENPGGGQFLDSTTRVNSGPGVTVDRAVVAVMGTPDWDTTRWTFTPEGEAGSTFGPLRLRGTPVPVGTLGFPPNPSEGRQALWLAGTGSVSRVVEFARTGNYALRFQAAAKVGMETGVRLTVDGVNVTPRGASHREPTDDHWVPGSGFARDYRQFENNGSFVFTITNPGPHTLRLAATGFPRYYNPFDVRVDPARQVYFDALEIASVDALFEGGIPANGEANGQPGQVQGAVERRLGSQARYAQAYGLAVVAYEGGWSLGGDFGAVPIQNWAKFRDDRARVSAVDSMDQFARSGGAIYTWGTYTTWPRGEIERSEDYPLTRGVDEHGSRLPPEPMNGWRIPATLTSRDATWSLASTPVTGQLTEPGAWLGWNLLAPVTADYELRLVTTGPGTVRVVVDGRPVGAPVESGFNGVVPVRFSRGLHHVRIQAVSGTPSVPQIEMALPGVPAAPTSVVVLDEDGAATVRWEMGGAGLASTGFVVRYGTESGYLNRSLEVAGGELREVRLTGLVNGTRYFMTVAARNDVGPGPASAEVGTLPFGDGDRVPLVVFEFTGNRGTETSAGARVVSSRVRAGVIRRGPGLLPSTYPTVARDTFGSVANRDVYGADFAQSRQLGQYYEFTVEPASGHRMTVEALRFRPYFQNATGEPGDSRGAGVTYSTNGVDFVPVPVPGVASYFGTTEFALGLGALPALSGVAGPVVFRIHLFGNGPYEFTGLGGPADDLVVEGRLERSAVEAPRVALLREAGGLVLETTSRAGRSYRLQRSVDLVRWDNLEVRPGTGAPLRFPLSVGAEVGGAFFRVGVP
jgi:hypothetical protein